VEEQGAPSPAAQAAAQTVRVDHSTAEVLRAFERAGVSCIVMKGPALARWLYEPHERRAYRDSDLLVAPRDWAAAQRVLSEMGFVARGELLSTPWWNTHAVEWAPPAGHALVDLHYTLQGVGVEPERVWSIVSRRLETLEIGGFPAPVLTVPGLALTHALHACHHGPGWPALAELERALAREDEATWVAAAALAAELDAVETFAAGLRLVSEGRELADRLGLPDQTPLEIALAPNFAPPGALSVERFTSAPSMRRRLAMIRYALVPPPSVVRPWQRRGHSGRRELLRAYAVHAIGVAWRAPAAVRAWRRARRAPGSP